MKVNKTVIASDGKGVATVGIDLPAMTKEHILQHLSVEQLGPMDGYYANKVHEQPVISVSIAQAAAWTYETYVFTVAASQ